MPDNIYADQRLKVPNSEKRSPINFRGAQYIERELNSLTEKGFFRHSTFQRNHKTFRLGSVYE
jgi:hypothetical protein